MRQAYLAGQQDEYDRQDLWRERHREREAARRGYRMRADVDQKMRNLQETNARAMRLVEESRNPPLMPPRNPPDKPLLPPPHDPSEPPHDHGIPPKPPLPDVPPSEPEHPPVSNIPPVQPEPQPAAIEVQPIKEPVLEPPVDPKPEASAEQETSPVSAEP